jgi:hypothetical protein
MKSPELRLTPRTEALIDRLFPPEERDTARGLLRTEAFRFGNDEVCHDRLCFAALKLSHGNMDELRRAVDLARSDYRDLLMYSGFGRNIHAHEAWFEEVFR